MTVSRLRVLVVDDEPPARERLLSLIADEHELDVVGEAKGGTSAIRMIAQKKPDLVFLDVQMPGCDGFDVIRSTAAFAPVVIFVTAYDQHAIRAFEVQAVDYLLKPVVESRFRAAVKRAVKRLRESSAETEAARLSALLEQLPQASGAQIPIVVQGAVVFVKCADIVRVEASDDHVKIYAGRQPHLTRTTMSKMESLLGPSFVRIHRSWIVNTSHIREIKPLRSGEYAVRMKDGSGVRSGRGYSAAIAALQARAR